MELFHQSAFSLQFYKESCPKIKWTSDSDYSKISFNLNEFWVRHNNIIPFGWDDRCQWGRDDVVWKFYTRSISSLYERSIVTYFYIWTLYGVNFTPTFHPQANDFYRSMKHLAQNVSRHHISTPCFYKKLEYVGILRRTDKPFDYWKMWLHNRRKNLRIGEITISCAFSSYHQSLNSKGNH